LDIDPQALVTTTENAERNNVVERLRVTLPQDKPEYEADIVLANILAAPLRELHEVISSYCLSGGKIILSGILIEQAQAIADLYTADFTIDAIVEDGDWASISGTKR
jgi:ribosomal protein L11 methyltransferase